MTERSRGSNKRPSRVAEAILLDGEPLPPADDLRQARGLALLLCKSEERSSASSRIAT
jgi:hypothetical protein